MMKRYGMVLLAAILLLSFGVTQAESLSDRFQYLNPIPGSELVSNQTSIILRTNNHLTSRGLNNYNYVNISGSESGNHSFTVINSTDDKTIILKPHSEFYPGELVSVNFKNGNSFSFKISPKTSPLLTVDDWADIYKENYGEYPVNDKIENKSLVTNDNSALPSDFPIIDIPINDNPAPGKVFLSNHGFDYGTTPYLMILKNDGTPAYFKKMERLVNCFRVFNNNLITYFDFERGMVYDNVVYAMNQTYTVVDSFRMGNGYIADQHAFQLLEGHHSLMLAYDPQTINMSDSIAGGNTAAIVIGLIIQELDSLKNVIFEWRSWDHFSIMDTPFWDLTSHRIDYAHGNSLDIDIDGHIIVSCRNMNEITKIDRTTGDIIWRLGKKAINNEFTFVGDTAGFYCQHYAQILDNGHLICYDNGNYHTPSYSRGVEYEIDNVSMTCTQVWDYRNSPDIYGPNRGGAQRLSNGNTMIGWGGNAGVTATEVRQDGSKTFEINIGENTVETSYRAYRFPWTGIASKPSLFAEQTDDGIHLVFYKFGDLSITDYVIYADQSPNPTSPIDTTEGNYYLPEYLNGLTYYFRVAGIDYSGIEGSYSNEVSITSPNLYTPGDVNGDNMVIGADVTFLVNYFRGQSIPADSCWNPSSNSWLYSAADVNGDCMVIGADVTYLVNYFRGQNGIKWCPDTRPYGYLPE